MAVNKTTNGLPAGWFHFCFSESDIRDCSWVSIFNKVWRISEVIIHFGYTSREIQQLILMLAIKLSNKNCNEIL